MPPSLRAADAAATASAANNVSVVNPSWSGSATPLGDVIAIWCATFAAGVTFSCTGFIAQTVASNSRSSCQILWRVTNGTEGATFTVNSSSSKNFAAAAISFFNENQAAPFDPQPPSSGIVSNSQSTTMANSGLTLIDFGDVLIWFGAVFNNGAIPTITVPGGYTAQVSQTNSGTSNGVGIIVATANASGDGATGAVNGSSSVSAFYATALAGVAIPVPPAAFTAQPGSRPRWAPRISRGRFFTPGNMPQASQGVQFPLFTRQGGNQPKWGPKLRRGMESRPVPPQGNQGIQFPLFTRQGGYQPKWGPYLRRGHVMAPGLGQANQGVQFPLFTRGQAGWHPRWAAYISRGRFFLPGWGQTGNDPPATVFFRQPGIHPRWQPPRHLVAGRIFQPGWGQGNQGTPFPLFTRQATRSSVWGQLTRTRPGRIVMLPYVPVTRSAILHLSGSGTMILSAFLVRRAAASWSGTGTMKIAGVRQMFDSASWSGSGTMRLNPVVVKNAAASWSGSGTMSLSPGITRVAALALQGAGSMSLAGADFPGLRMQGSGTMTFSARVTQQATLGLTGAGQMTLSVMSAPPDRLILIEPGAVTSPAQVIATGTYQEREPAEGASQVYVTEVDDGQFDEPDE